MKISIIVTLLIPLTTVYAATCRLDVSKWLHTKEGQQFLAVLAEIESGNNPKAVGDNGKAIGLYQIHRAYWTDATQYGKVSWDYPQVAYDPAKSKQVVIWYLSRYAPKAWTPEILARIHNGGPRGYKTKATDKYIEKFYKKIERKKK